MTQRCLVWIIGLDQSLGQVRECGWKQLQDWLQRQVASQPLMLRARRMNKCDARSDECFLTFGQDPSPPEEKWLAATELKKESLAQQPSQDNLPTMTPTSAARTLFSPSLPPVAGSSPNLLVHNHQHSWQSSTRGLILQLQQQPPHRNSIC